MHYVRPYAAYCEVQERNKGPLQSPVAAVPRAATNISRCLGFRVAAPRVTKFSTQVTQHVPMQALRTSARAVKIEL